MSSEKKKPTRRSVKKQTEKMRAKQEKKAQAKEKKEKAQPNKLPLKEVVANNPVVEKLKKSDNKRTEEDTSKPNKLPPEKAVVNNPIAQKIKRSGGRKTKGDTNTRLRWPQIILIILLVLILALVGLFAWDRWLRYDDAQDIQGEWIFTSEGSSVPVDINADRILFSSDVKFPYTMDVWGKTIEFNFSDLAGKGVYRFSLDRQTLYIAEDTNEDIFVSVQVSLGWKEPTEGFDLSKTTILTKQDSTADNALSDTVSSEDTLTENTMVEDGITEEVSGNQGGEETNIESLDAVDSGSFNSYDEE